MLPNRKKLATIALKNCHQEPKKKVDQRMKNETACLTRDRWSNINNEAVVNYMAVSTGCSLYLEAVQTRQQGHDHKFISEEVERVFINYKDTIFAGAAIDNTSAKKKAWEVLTTNYPSSFFQGCTSHGLHLLVKDISCATHTRSWAAPKSRIWTTTRLKIC